MDKKSSGIIRVGIGGWTYEPWRGAFYPEKHPRKQELEYASRQLTSIEINSTYYGSQKPESFRKWYGQTPDDFVFAVKAPRYATHRKQLAEAKKSVDRFLASGISELKHKLGPINWQFAPAKEFEADDFEAFLEWLPQRIDDIPLRHAIEIRHESFQSTDFIALARKYGVAVVVAADSKYPLIADITAPFVYVRLMGTQTGKPLGYPASALTLLASRLRMWSEGITPKGFSTLAPAQTKAVRTDVYLYVIGGNKTVNPHAAKSLIARLA